MASDLLFRAFPRLRGFEKGQKTQHMEQPARARPYALVVDDNPAILLHAADAMDAAGFCTFGVGEADHALDRLGEHGAEIAVMFIDIKIPGRLDGLALGRYVAARWPHIGMIVSSSYVEPSAEDLPAGAIFLAKPFSQDDIADSIRKLTGIARSQSRIDN